MELEKKTVIVLNEELNKVQGWLHTYWKHYMGDVYHITGFAFDCTSNDLMVVYKKMATGYENIFFTRSLIEWCAVNMEGNERFTMI